MIRFVIYLEAIFMITPLMGQEEKSPLVPRSMYDGFVVTTNGDTIHGHIMFMTVIANQFNVQLYQQQSDTKPIGKYKPKDLISYAVGDQHYVTVPFSGKGFSRNKSFMIRLADGPVALYKWYYDESLMLDGEDISAATGQEQVLSVDLDEGIVVQYFGVREDGKPVDFSSVKFGMNFKKQMSKYVSDCPELAQKIASKQPGYGYYDLAEIINEYNQWLMK